MNWPDLPTLVLPERLVDVERMGAFWVIFMSGRESQFLPDLHQTDASVVKKRLTIWDFTENGTLIRFRPQPPDGTPRGPARRLTTLAGATSSRASRKR